MPLENFHLHDESFKICSIKPAHHGVALHSAFASHTHSCNISSKALSCPLKSCDFNTVMTKECVYCTPPKSTLSSSSAGSARAAASPAGLSSCVVMYDSSRRNTN